MDEPDRPARFRDPSTTVYDLAAEDIYVVCPRCGSRAVVTAQRVEAGSVFSWPRRFTCTSCTYSAAWPKERGACWGVPVDPFFRFPLWLKAGCCGGRTLWAYNRTHLDLLEQYVAAKLRERATTSYRMTLLARLPAWMKSAKNRDEVLRMITRLRASLDG